MAFLNSFFVVFFYIWLLLVVSYCCLFQTHKHTPLRTVNPIYAEIKCLKRDQLFSNIFFCIFGTL